MMRKRRRPDAFGRRGIYNKDWVVRWPLGDSFPTARTEIFDGSGDCLCHNQPALRCREFKLLLPVHDRSGFKQNCGH
jgi:hypothetical protein